ncbi:MAG: hypothetical protein PHO44_03080 [Sphaerochaetaceae bacterium]|nr:hypothetical protein [Sphaerochaetaceae bacterium]MDD3162952.1 hypothetical protein [Sphaerochaetaceae bacterium]MDD4006943.1 hypothetical protein [Sphaerochaetaceae bacterium]
MDNADKLAENEKKIAELKSQADELALKISNHAFKNLGAGDFEKAIKLFNRSKALSPSLADPDLGLLLSDARLNTAQDLLDEDQYDKVDDLAFTKLSFKVKDLSCEEDRKIVENVIARNDEKELQRKIEEGEQEMEQRRIESASQSSASSSYSYKPEGSGCLKKGILFLLVAFVLFCMIICSL